MGVKYAFIRRNVISSAIISGLTGVSLTSHGGMRMSDDSDSLVPRRSLYNLPLVRYVDFPRVSASHYSNN